MAWNFPFYNTEINIVRKRVAGWCGGRRRNYYQVENESVVKILFLKAKWGDLQREQMNKKDSLPGEGETVQVAYYVVAVVVVVYYVVACYFADFAMYCAYCPY